jgi:hypothetical protein
MLVNRTGIAKTLANDSVITVAKGQVSSELANEVIILDLNAGVYYGLNPVGARVWALIQQPTTVRDITKTIIAEYDVELAQCEHEIGNLLEDLLAKGLIYVRDEV